MFAMVREGTSDPEKMARGRGQAEEFQRIRAQQPGYRGSVTVDAGNGRVLIVTLWETQEQAQAARATLEPEAERLLGPLWTAPAQVIASGPVLYNDVSQT
ncbi:MAG: hypothetical protein H0V51_14385 [Chloroflexi bacterium]|nr:hypothetical protein [Chloroflexota bacterium]